MTSPFFAVRRTPAFISPSLVGGRHLPWLLSAVHLRHDAREVRAIDAAIGVAGAERAVDTIDREAGRLPGPTSDSSSTSSPHRRRRPSCRDRHGHVPAPLTVAGIVEPGPVCPIDVGRQRETRATPSRATRRADVRKARPSGPKGLFVTGISRYTYFLDPRDLS
jgi:hypothetical protein